MAASLLAAVDMPELVAADLAAYEALALRLAQQPTMLDALKARLAAGRSTFRLFDTGRFTRNLETAYAHMWQRAQNGLPPAPIADGAFA